MRNTRTEGQVTTKGKRRWETVWKKLLIAKSTYQKEWAENIQCFIRAQNMLWVSFGVVYVMNCMKHKAACKAALSLYQKCCTYSWKVLLKNVSLDWSVTLDKICIERMYAQHNVIILQIAFWGGAVAERSVTWSKVKSISLSAPLVFGCKITLTSDPNFINYSQRCMKLW